MASRGYGISGSGVDFPTTPEEWERWLNGEPGAGEAPAGEQQADPAHRLAGSGQQQATEDLWVQAPSASSLSAVFDAGLPLPEQPPFGGYSGPSLHLGTPEPPPAPTFGGNTARRQPTQHRARHATPVVPSPLARSSTPAIAPRAVSDHRGPCPGLPAMTDAGCGATIQVLTELLGARFARERLAVPAKAIEEVARTVGALFADSEPVRALVSAQLSHNLLTAASGQTADARWGCPRALWSHANATPLSFAEDAPFWQSQRARQQDPGLPDELDGIVDALVAQRAPDRSAVGAASWLGMVLATVYGAAVDVNVMNLGQLFRDLFCNRGVQDVAAVRDSKGQMRAFAAALAGAAGPAAVGLVYSSLHRTVFGASDRVQ